MIIVYTGTPGSGKSYHATRQIHRAIKEGKNVIANFNVDVKKPERFFYCPTERIDVKSLVEFSKKYHVPDKESQTILFIDEASILFNTRDVGMKGRRDWLKFFSQHRKLGFDVILITQMDRALDRQIRGNIEYNYIHRKLTNYGLKGFFVRLIKFGSGYVCIHKWYGNGETVGNEFFSVKKKIAKTYNTFSMFDEKDSVIKPLAKREEVKEVETDDTTKETSESETADTETEKVNLLINNYINHLRQCNNPTT